MKIDHIVAVDALHTDGKRFSGMERESDQAARRRRSTILETGEYAKFQQAGIAAKKTYGKFSASLGSLQDRYPFVVITKKAQVQIWRITVALCAYWQLGEDAFGGFDNAAPAGAHNGLLETILQQPSVEIVVWRTW